MFERYTDRARKVMHLAERAARRFAHWQVECEDLLWGLAEEGTGVAAWALRNLGIEPCMIQSRLLVGTSLTDSSDTARSPRSGSLDEVLKLAAEEATNLGHTHVGTEHLLLGLLHQQNSSANRVLSELGVSKERIRREVLVPLGLPEQKSDWLTSMAEEIETMTICTASDKKARVAAIRAIVARHVSKKCDEILEKLSLT